MTGSGTFLHKRNMLLGSFPILLSYLYGIFRESAWSDDWQALEAPDNDFKQPLRDGRPLFALFQKMSFGILSRDPSHLFVLRFFSLVFLLLVYILVGKRLGLKTTKDFILLSVGFTLPSFQWFVYWSTLWTWLLPILFSIVASNLWGKEGNRRWLGVVPLTLALLIYPLNSLFAFSLLFVEAIILAIPIHELKRRLLSLLKIYFVSTLISLVIIRFSLFVFQVAPSAKVTENVSLNELPTKFWWWITRPVVTAFRPFLIDSPGNIAAVMSCLPILLLIGFILFKQAFELNENSLVRGMFLSLIAIIPLMPLLVAKQNQIDFRLVASWDWGILQVSIWYLGIRLTKFTRIKLLTLILLVSFSIYQSNLNYVRTFLRPYELKNHFLHEEIDKCGAYLSVVILPPKEEWPSYSLLGNFSTVTDLAHSWVPKPNIQFLARKINPDKVVNVTFRNSREGSDDLTSSDFCVIDLEIYRVHLLNQSQLNIKKHETERAGK
jgi:hypothetical protein